MPLTIVFAPDTALLLPALVTDQPRSGRDGALQDALTQLDALRDECLAQLTAALAEDCHRVALIAPGAQFGAEGEPDQGLVALGISPLLDPLADHQIGQGSAAAVGSWLLDTAGWVGARTVISTSRYDDACAHRAAGAAQDSSAPARSRTVLLALGSGSARIHEQSPLPPSDRARAFDQSLASALASGDPQALAAVCDEVGADQAAELGITGWGPWQAVIGACAANESQAIAEVPFAEVVAPFGVSYPLARWELA